MGQQDRGDLGHADPVGGILATGHGDGAVVEQLVGHPHVGGDGRLDGQLSGMEEGPVADVLGEVLPLDEWGHPDPLAAFTAHGRDPGAPPDLVLLHEEDHPVATDTGADEGILGDLGSPVVGATGAEVGGPLDRQREQGVLADRGLGREPVRQPGREALPEADEDRVGVQDPVVGHEGASVRVGLADDAGLVGAAVEGVLHQPFERRVLLLDDEDLVQAAGEGADDRRFERHRDPHVE